MAARPQFTYIDACAGYGGFSLAFKIIFGERAKCALAIERDTCAGLGAPPVWSDLLTFDGKPWRGRVDCFAAGFPCQPWSQAGQGKGTDDERWLWPALARAIRDVGPWLVLLENVPGLVSGGGLEHVLFDLAEMGFDAEWGCLAASDVEATQERERIFIVGVANADRRRQQACNGALLGEWAWQSFIGSCGGEVACASNARCDEREDTGTDSGDAAEVGRGGEQSERICAPVGRPSATVGDAAGERRNGGTGRARGRRVGPADAGPKLRRELGLAESGSAGLQGDERERRPSHGSIAQLRRAPLWPPGPGDIEGWRRVLEHCPELAPALSEPEFRRLADGLASRTDMLRLFGNGVVPLAAAAAFLALANRF